MSLARTEQPSRTPASVPDIRVRGLRVHNLKEIDVEIPAGGLTVICGVSGSGKSSLAIDTLFAEGQRRFVESLPPYTRRRLTRLDRPDADAIDGIPPAVAISVRELSLRRHATMGTLTEISHFLRLLFARLGTVHCPACGAVVKRDSPQTVAHRFAQLPEGCRAMVGFRRSLATSETWAGTIRALREDGFHRAVLGGRTVDLTAVDLADASHHESLDVVVDRLTAGRTSLGRARESLEMAFAYGEGDAVVWIEADSAGDRVLTDLGDQGGRSESIDGRSWMRCSFANRLVCPRCGEDVMEPEPRLFNPSSPLGRCDACDGTGRTQGWHESRIVSNPFRTILGGAIGPWSDRELASEVRTWWGRLPSLGVPLHVPYSDLNEAQRDVLWHGSADDQFPGVLKQLDAWESRSRRPRKFDRWKAEQICSACDGSGLGPMARAVTLEGHAIHDVERWGVGRLTRWLEMLPFPRWHEPVARQIIPQVVSKLDAVARLGLDYLSPARPLETLSRGELQRSALASALSSSLVHLLYVFDEPTIGLHPVDVQRLVPQLTSLRDRGNTVVLIDHTPELLAVADHIIELGPSGGDEGGEVIFAGGYQSLSEPGASLTGDYLTGTRPILLRDDLRPLNRGALRLTGAVGHNLHRVDVAFPLGVLCVVTGPSGSGKTTLVRDTLYRALAQRLDLDVAPPLPHDRLDGGEELDDVTLVEATPLSRTARACPATYVKAFDEIRQVFAQTSDAQIRNYTAATFSFNNEGGRCEECRGEGFLTVDMSFLADARMKCPVCQGRRFRRKVLEVRHRGRSIADVLDMTIREAFAFFRGKPKVQTRLQRLLDVGLGYLRLGQPLQTLSAGESQRLKLAGQLVANRRKRTLFVLEEPTSGLHHADIVKIVDCFDSLLSVGHSLIIVDHHPHLIAAADYVIELGPGAAEDGGRLVTEGRPRRLIECPESVTGPFLRRYFDGASNDV